MTMHEGEIRQLMLEGKTHYIYDNEEVFATGRTAEKKVATTSRRVGSTVKADPILIEIRPVSAANGDWTKWVQETELYEIIDNSTE